MKRLIVWQLIAISLLVVPIMVRATTIEVLGKHQRSDGSIHDFKIQDGDALSPGDRFQILIQATNQIYYSIVYFSRDGQATQLFPVTGKRGLIRSGANVYLPTRDNFFTLDSNGGRELMFIVTSLNPLSNLKSALRGSQEVGNSPQAIYQYLNKRLPNVAKLEITNTGGKVSGLTDQVSSSLVRDISATYEANPWNESFSKEPERRKRTRQGDDNSIPEEVRRRAQEVRALLRRPAGAPNSSSLRTTAAQKSSPPASMGSIRRDTPMLANQRSEQRAVSRQLEQERAAQAKAEEEIKRLESERKAARLAAEERKRLEAEAEAARIAAENRRLEKERLTAALAEEEAQRLEMERIAAEKAAQEAEAQEQRRIELAKAEVATKKLEEERIAAAQAAAEVERLEREREAARIAAKERRRQENEAEASRIAAENQRLEEQRLAQAKAAAEIERLEQERGAASQAKAPSEPEKSEMQQQTKKGFFGTIASILGSDSDEASPTVPADGVERDSTDEPLTKDAIPVESTLAAEPQAPVEAVVVLQAPIRSQPAGMTAPAPDRAQEPQEQAASARDIRHLYDQVASAIVSVRTENDAQASGFVLDNKGHVLTSWHAINGVKDIDVQFMAIAGAQRSYKAQVVRQDKFRDLALLKLVDSPEGIQPITLASGSLPDAGTTVRVFGQKQGKIWASDDAVITRIAKNFTWFSVDNVIHRGEILQIDLPKHGEGVGALVTSMDYKMLGIKSFSGKETGRTYAVSVHNILDFLQPKK